MRLFDGMRIDRNLGCLTGVPFSGFTSMSTSIAGSYSPFAFLFIEKFLGSA
jgi:hypothetical protein